jgi:hypothetical protein
MHLCFVDLAIKVAMLALQFFEVAGKRHKSFSLSWCRHTVPSPPPRSPAEAM